jgi:hypothetical protein
VHVSLCRVPGSGDWLTAPPCVDGRHMEAPLFKVALRRRLRCAILDSDGYFPCCGQVLDRYGDHVLVCACGGDRTVRHNAIRDTLYRASVEANLSPEREKAGLLPGRPSEDGLPMRSGRRPADVWLPKGRRNLPEAVDFAVTSGMRSDLFRLCREFFAEFFFALRTN